MKKYLFLLPLFLTGCSTPEKTVLVGGCFDVLHSGHIRFLEKAKEQGTHLVVALEPDEHIRQYKHRDPIHTQHQRAYNLKSLRAVDEVVLLPRMHGFDDYKALVEDIRPQIIAVTEGDPQSDNKSKQAQVVGAQMIAVTDEIKGFSTSAIITHGCTSPQSEQ